MNITQDMNNTQKMRDKVYKKFKAVPVNGTWAVVTDDTSGLVIVKVAPAIKYPKGVAEAIAKALTESNLALTDLI